jgi:hypothetical protein
MNYLPPSHFHYPLSLVTSFNNRGSDQCRGAKNLFKNLLGAKYPRRVFFSRFTNVHKKAKLIFALVILSIWLYAGALVVPSSLNLFGTFGYNRYITVSDTIYLQLFKGLCHEMKFF